MEESVLVNIINKTQKQPTIVNEQSNFVVVTYWWGRGNLNNNTVRPCALFYQSFVSQVTTLAVKYLNTVNPEILPDKLEILIAASVSKYYTLISSKSKEYMNMIYDYLNIKIKSIIRDEFAKTALNKLKETNKTPSTFFYKNVCEVEEIFNILIQIVIKLNSNEIFNLYKLNIELAKLNEEFINNKKIDNIDTDEKKQNRLIILNKIKQFKSQKNDIQTAIKNNLNAIPDISILTNLINKYPDIDFNNKSTYNILNLLFKSYNVFKLYESNNYFIFIGFINGPDRWLYSLKKTFKNSYTSTYI
jgi:hypothetical protein